VGIVREEIDELVAERGERSATANARMIVDEEDQLAERCELVRERLRELGEAPLEAAATVQRGREPLGEIGGVTAQGADEIGKEDERILVAASKGEPGDVPPGGTQEVGVLRQDGRLAIAGGGVHEGQPVALRAAEPIEQPLPPEKR
jgi:hypothetical protein